MERVSRTGVGSISMSAGAGSGDSLSDRLLGQRIVLIGRAVDDEVSNVVCSQLLLLAGEDPRRDIALHINSSGGSISAAMAIHDTMQAIEPDVATVAQGTAASMGQFLLSAGAAGKRSALAHSKIMMHQPSGGLGGTASDVRIRSEQITRQKRELAELIAGHTGQPVEQVEADCDRDRWFTPAEAIEYGLIDRVVGR